MEDITNGFLKSSEEVSGGASNGVIGEEDKTGTSICNEYKTGTSIQNKLTITKESETNTYPDCKSIYN